MVRIICAHIGLACLLLVGCSWEPERDNPLDPGNRNYQPNGKLRIVALDQSDSSTISNAEVRIPVLNRFILTNNLGSALFSELPIQMNPILVTAERRSNGTVSPYALDSIRVSISDNTEVRDTLWLKALPPANGRLELRVLALDRQPIRLATVMLTELGRFAYTDVAGIASFNDVPVGFHWVRAFRLEGSGAIYSRDSLYVEIKQAMLTSTEIRLDALPSFTSSVVNSYTYINRPRETPAIYQIHLKASVTDPDGPQDLQTVIWRLYNASGVEILHDTLVFIPDSNFWKAEEPAEIFPTGKPNGVLTLPFYFDAYDRAGNASRSNPTYLARPILDVPFNLSYATGVEPQLTLDWDFFWSLSFQDTSAFYYIVRIFDSSLLQKVYEAVELPTSFQTTRHQVTTILQPALYLWEVWAVDYFGNRSRSARSLIHIIGT